jgi:hypothetical protein
MSRPRPPARAAAGRRSVCAPMCSWWVDAAWSSGCGSRSPNGSRSSPTCRCGHPPASCRISSSWAVPSVRPAVRGAHVEILEAVARSVRSCPNRSARRAPTGVGEAARRDRWTVLLASWAGRMARTFERYLMYRHDCCSRGSTVRPPTIGRHELWRAVARRRRARSSRRRNAARCDATCCCCRPPVCMATDWRHDGSWCSRDASRPPISRSCAALADVQRGASAGAYANAAPCAMRLVETRRRTRPAERRAPPACGHELDWIALRVDGCDSPRCRCWVTARVTIADDHARDADESPSDATTLLAAVQRALRERAAVPPPPARAPAAGTTDCSLRVLACHGALRQVEVLKDALLGAFNRRCHAAAARRAGAHARSRALRAARAGGLSARPRERVRSAPRRAWHRRREHERGRRRWRCMCRAGHRAPPTRWPTCCSLLSLAEARVSASRVLDLLERGPVAERFGIASSDAPLVREWLQAAGVRWGIDASDPARAGLGLADEGTWRRGLTRLLVGVAVLDGSAGHDTHVHGLRAGARARRRARAVGR